ncbi:O-methyltransferase aurJ, partial [Lachnellula suecica]
MEASLEELAARITASAKVISSSSSNSVGSDQPPTAVPESVQRARQDLLYASREIQQLVSDPSEYLEQHVVNYQQLACLQWLVHFNIFNEIPLNASIPFTTVAALAKVPVGRLRSVARMAMTGGILSEPQPEYVAHSRISKDFSERPTLVDWAVFMTKYSAPTAAKFAQATERWGDTSEKNQTAYNVAFNTDLPFFVHLTKSPERSAEFAGYMRSLGESEGTAFKHILTGFDWGSVGKATLVDVGGSTGQASILLAKNYPELTFLVQDLPDTVANGPAVLSSLDPEIASRLTFTAQDILTPQPESVATTADIFFLRKIIHDWPDKDARTILSHISAALQKPGASIVIMDTILPKPGSVSAPEEASLRVRDLTMAQSFNSGERELGDWVALFESATPKLKLKDWKKPWGSVMSVMVV